MVQGMEQIKSEYEILNEENSHQQTQMNILQEQLNTALQDYSELKSELNNSVHELKRVSAEKELLISTDKSELCENLMQEKELLLIKAMELKRDAQIHESHIERLTRELSEAHGQIEGFAPERQLMEEKLNEQANIRRQLDSLMEENDQMKERLEKQMKGKEKDRDNLKQGVREMEEERREMEEKYAEMGRTLEVKHQEYDKVRWRGGGLDKTTWSGRSWDR